MAIYKGKRKPSCDPYLPTLQSFQKALRVCNCITPLVPFKAVTSMSGIGNEDLRPNKVSEELETN
jgi:hypothetical protein